MFGLKPKEDEFFKLFVDSSNVLRQGAYLLKDVMDNYIRLEEKMEEISKIEHQADDINDAIIDKLNQTFITPLDREDIYSLATMLDDVVDFQQGIMQRMVLYKAGKPTSGAAELAGLLAECTEEMVLAFALLKNIKGNQHKILDHTHKIGALESQGDNIYRREVALLFETCPDPIEIIKWKEILEYMENALDHCESIGDLLRGVVMKYA
ncbi:MAG: putative phosphate transport regulator [Firmicutes bacterium]|nr:putative phosphate transport regulator [Bacillota bacterium]